MESFLCHLVEELDLHSFGVSYEDLVPVTCSLKWTGINNSLKYEFTSSILKYLLPTSKMDSEYLILQSRILNLVDMYWEKIVEETIEFRRIRI